MWGFSDLHSCRGTVDTQELQQVALFEKCRQFTKARELQAVGLYPYFNPISESEDTVVVIDGQKRIMLGSNNYLGLTHHPKVLEAASRALHRYGSGCTGSRFLNGTLDLHEQLESALAEFVGKEACLVFSTGYSANLGLISGLVGRGDVVYLDKLDHASIVDGAKLSYGETERFNHGDLANLERRIERNGTGRGNAQSGASSHLACSQGACTAPWAPSRGRTVRARGAGVRGRLARMSPDETLEHLIDTIAVRDAALEVIAELVSSDPARAEAMRTRVRELGIGAVYERREQRRARSAGL